MPHALTRSLLLMLLALATPAVGADAPAARVEAGTKVNINTATVKELMTLAGVGRSVAERIVQHREKHGPFRRPADLGKVDGVGDTLWERNRARVVVR